MKITDYQSKFIAYELTKRCPSESHPTSSPTPHAQMQEHYWEEVVGYEVKVSKGFIGLKPSAYTCNSSEPPADYRVSPPDKSNMARFTVIDL